MRLILVLKLTKEIKIKNVDEVLLAKIDEYAKFKKISRSHVIRSILDLQFKYSSGSMQKELLTYEHIAKYACIQINRNQALNKEILEILNEN